MRSILPADSPSHIALHPLGVGAGHDAVVQRLERDPPLRELALDILVSVQAQLGIVGKVGAELQEERAEVLVTQ